MGSLSRGDVLFNVGEIPAVPIMYFCLSGKLHYHLGGAFADAVTVQLGQWACEPVLWTSWEHCGLMRAKTHCSLMGIVAENFQSEANKNRRDENKARSYALRFVRRLNDISKVDLTDLDGFDITALCSR